MTRKIDLTGPGGNAFALLALAKNWGKQIGFPREKTKEIQEKMIAGDYEHLLEVFQKAFPFVEFLRENEDDDEDE